LKDFVKEFLKFFPLRASGRAIGSSGRQLLRRGAERAFPPQLVSISPFEFYRSIV